MEIVYHHANDCFDQLVLLNREEISVLSGKYKGFTFVHPVGGRIDCIYGDAAIDDYAKYGGPEVVRHSRSFTKILCGPNLCVW